METEEKKLTEVEIFNDISVKKTQNETALPIAIIPEVSNIESANGNTPSGNVILTQFNNNTDCI